MIEFCATISIPAGMIAIPLKAHIQNPPGAVSVGWNERLFSFASGVVFGVAMSGGRGVVRLTGFQTVRPFATETGGQQSGPFLFVDDGFDRSPRGYL